MLWDAVSEGMLAVKLCSTKSSHFLTDVPVQVVCCETHNHFKYSRLVIIDELLIVINVFSVLTLLVARQEEYTACKN